MVEAPAVGLDPLRLDVVGRVARAGGVVEEERLVGRGHVRVRDHLDGVVGQVGVEVVALLGRGRGRDRRVVLHEVGEPLARVAAHEAVVPLEAPAERPGAVRPGLDRLAGRAEVPLADGERVVARVARGWRAGTPGRAPAIAWYPGKPIDSSTSAPTPTEWWLRPLRRQARVGEHKGVAWKFVYRRPRWRQAVERRHLAPAAERRRLGEADVVEHEEHDVRRSLRRPGHRRPGGLGVSQCPADPPGERRRLSVT